MISTQTREFVRSRAGFACEYCGITEADAGGELTIDHFHPTSKGGDNDAENLIYCCFRCNLFKSNFWLERTEAPSLWNPRAEPADTHFVEATDGRLLPLTATAQLTIRVLKLNRPQLIEVRLKKRFIEEEAQLINHYIEVSQLLIGFYRVRTISNQEKLAVLAEFKERLYPLLQLKGENPDE